MRDERGYAMAALLVALAVMGIMLSVALPVWGTAVQREREAELVFRGEQYARAIELFQRRTGGFPQSLDVLQTTRAIRRLYKDPITGGDFQPVYVGQIIGGQPVVPGQAGRGGVAGQVGGARGGAAGVAGANRLPGIFETQLGRANQARGGGFASQQPGIGGAGGPIIGVVSRSSAESLRLYNGRGKYNEWAFVATAMTQQAGAPTGAQTPGQPGRGGRGGQGMPLQGPGARPGGPARGMPFPSRGTAPPNSRGLRGFGGANVPPPP